jgi:hypothetical protein
MKLTMMAVIVIIASCRSPKVALQFGIKNNDYSKINNALNRGARFYIEDLSDAIQKNDLTLTDFIMKNGIASENGIILAAKYNNLDAFKIALNYKPRMTYNIIVLDGQIEYVDPNSHKVLSTIDPEKADKKNNDVYGGVFYRYKTKKVSSGSMAMYYAICADNSDMVDLLIENKYDILLPFYSLEYKNPYQEQLGYNLAPNNLMQRIWRSGGTINIAGYWEFTDDKGFIISNAYPSVWKKSGILDIAKKLNRSKIVKLLENKIKN